MVERCRAAIPSWPPNKTKRRKRPIDVRVELDEQGAAADQRANRWTRYRLILMCEAAGAVEHVLDDEARDN